MALPVLLVRNLKQYKGNIYLPPFSSFIKNCYIHSLVCTVRSLASVFLNELHSLQIPEMCSTSRASDNNPRFYLRSNVYESYIFNPSKHEGCVNI
jgi:hypothetical protein